MSEKKINIAVNGVMFTVDENAFSQASEAGTLEIKSEEHVIRTKVDHDKYVENVTGERYRAGKEKGEKDAVNASALEQGIELDETKKTVKNLFAVYSEKVKVEANIEPNQKITALEQRSTDALALVKKWEGDYNDLNNRYNGSLQQQKVDNLINVSFPVDEKGEKVKTKIPTGDLNVIFKNRYKTGFEEDGREYVAKDGKKLQNTSNLDNLTVKEVYADFVKPYIETTTPIGGSGDGGDGTGNDGPGTLVAFNKEMEGNNIKMSSREYNEEMHKRIKEKTLKV
ncbi:hypothetical protein KAR91_36885 [Candidatus Pacearchaeota archaeon]|nr:hypothetical protein [Candidatus Pacearchaeota archaeon]